jgi:hypothetical protein
MILTRNHRVGTDFSFPVPWRSIPENIYVTLKLIYTVLFLPDRRDVRSNLIKRGAFSPKRMPPTGTPWISQTMTEASIPLDVVPQDVVSVGPIVISTAPAAEQDPELVEWLEKAPTVIVNLGSLFRYTQEHIDIMAQAIQIVLDRTEIQVIWKLAAEKGLEVDFNAEFREYMDKKRVIVTDWLTVDPTTLFQTGHIVASVHHGGAGCYYEAI